MTDQLSVARVTWSHCTRACRPSQLSVCLPACMSVSLGLSNCLPPSQCPVVWVSLCRFSFRRVNVFLSTAAAGRSVYFPVCLSTSSNTFLTCLPHLQPTHLPIWQLLFIFNSHTPGFFHGRDLNLFAFLSQAIEGRAEND